MVEKNQGHRTAKHQDKSVRWGCALIKNWVHKKLQARCLWLSFLKGYSSKDKAP
jgi:hypothetical protein